MLQNTMEITGNWQAYPLWGCRNLPL